MYSIFGGAVDAFHRDPAKRLHVLGGAVRPQRLGMFSHCSTNTILAGSVTLSCRS